MAVTIGTVMRACRNYFEREYLDGEFSIVEGSLSPVLDAPYVYISGSKTHDGVWKLTNGILDGEESDAPEAFNGRVWGLYPPTDFLSIVEEAAEYDAKAPVSGLVSESFAGYSYTRGKTASGMPATWQDVFAARMIPYRKMFTEVG